MTYRILLSVAIVVVAIVIGIILYSMPSGKPIPTADKVYFYAAIVLVSGYLIIRIISTLLERLVEPAFGVNRGHALKNFFQIVAAIILVLVVLSTFGPNLTNLLIGAGFVGIVLGLAAQQTLGNLFAGVALFASHPFEIGDRLTLIPSAYSLNPMTYNHENLLNGYTGVVKDIGLYYTRLQTDEGLPLALPNSVVLGSLVLNHSKAKERSVRMRIDLDKSVDLNEFSDELKVLLKSSSGAEIINPETLRVEIANISIQTYQVVITLWTKSPFEEPVKTIIAKSAIEAQQRILAKQPKGTTTNS